MINNNSNNGNRPSGNNGLNEKRPTFEEWAVERSKALKTCADEIMAQEAQGSLRAAVMAVLMWWERDVLQYVDEDLDPALESLREKTEAARCRSTESLTWMTPLEPFLRALFSDELPRVIKALVAVGQEKLLEIGRVGMEECIFVDGDLALFNPLPGDNCLIVRKLSLEQVRQICDALVEDN